MKTISVSEFRNNIKKYVEIADKEKIIVHRGKGKSFAIVPIDELEDSPYNQKFVSRVLKADQEIEQGKGVKLNLEDLPNEKTLSSIKETKEKPLETIKNLDTFIDDL